MTDVSIKELAREFIQYAQGIIGDESHVMHRELKVIGSLFDKYDEDGLKRYFKEYVGDRGLMRALTSFNYGLISQQSIQLKVSSTSKKIPKIRIGSLYKKAEEMSRSAIEELEDDKDPHAHITLMIHLLSIFDAVADNNDRISKTISIYEQMRGNDPEPNELMGLLNMVPGFQSGISNFLPPEFFTKVKAVVAEHKHSDLTPEKIKELTTDILDSIPAIAPQKEFLSGLLTKLFENPDMINNLAENPSSLMSVLMTSSPFGGGSSTTTTAPPIDVSSMLGDNPYQ